MTGTIIDISIGAIFLIAIIVGLKRGLIRQLTSLLNGLISFAGAVLLTILAMKFLKPTPFFQNFTWTATGWYTAELFSVEVASPDELAFVLSNSGAWRILSGISDTVFSLMQAVERNTFGGFLGYYTAVAIAEFTIWLVSYILLVLILKLIRKVLLKAVSLPVINSVDRVFGALWAIIVAYVVLIGFALTTVELVAAQFFPDMMTTIGEFISQSVVLKFANDTNIIGSWIAGYLGMELPSL